MTTYSYSCPRYYICIRSHNVTQSDLSFFYWTKWQISFPGPLERHIIRIIQNCQNTMSGNEWWKRNVLSCWRKDDSDSVETTSSDRLFQICDTALRKPCHSDSWQLAPPGGHCQQIGVIIDRTHRRRRRLVLAVRCTWWLTLTPTGRTSQVTGLQFCLN